MINNYFVSLNSSIQSIAAGCINLTAPRPGRYTPMVRVNQTQPQAMPIGLELSANGSINLALLITNPTQTNLYISGLGLGGLYCSFSNDLTLSAGSQGTLTITLYSTGGVIEGTAELITYAGVMGTQETTLECRGSQTFMVGAYYTGYLMLTNGEELQFQVQAIDSTIPLGLMS
jgi:hypothetical protein